MFSVQRAELIADDETESVFAGAAAPRVAVDDLVDPDGRYIFLNLKNLGQVWVEIFWCDLVNCSRKNEKFNRGKSRNGLVCQDRFLAELNYLISEQKNQDSQIFNQL